jgi:uncharacterized membrane protein YbhN (UPF0104 family)
VKLALRLGGFAIAVAIFAFLVSRIGVQAIFDQLSQVGPGFAWILVLHLGAMIAAALPWRELLRPDQRPTIVATIASRFLASGTNAALPVLGIGGELTRLLWLPRSARAAGAAALVVDRIAYGVATIVVLAAGLVGLLHAPAMPARYAHIAAITGAAIAILLVVASLLAVRGGVTARIMRLLRRESSFGEDVDTELAQTLRLRSRGLWSAIALHVAGRALIGAEIVVGFYLLGTPLPWDQGLVFGALPVIIAFIGAVVPSQLGVHEGAQALVAASFGISPAVAVAVILLLRLRQLAGLVLVGPYFLLPERFSRFVKIRRGTAEKPAR